MSTQTYSQAPARLDLSLTSGDDWGIQMTFTDAQADPINLTGYTFAAAAVHTDGSVVSITVTGTDVTNGVIDLSLTDTQTAAVYGKFRWYLTYTAGADTLTPVAGQMTILRRGDVR